MNKQSPNISYIFHEVLEDTVYRMYAFFYNSSVPHVIESNKHYRCCYFYVATIALLLLLFGTYIIIIQAIPYTYWYVYKKLTQRCVFKMSEYRKNVLTKTCRANFLVIFYWFSKGIVSICQGYDMCCFITKVRCDLVR